MNKKGAGFGWIIKIFAVLLGLAGLVFVLYNGDAFGFNLAFLTEEVMKYLLLATGVLIFFGSFKSRFFGKKWLGVLIGLILLALSAHLVAVQVGYMNEIIGISGSKLHITMIIYGVYLLLQGWIL